MQVHSSLRLISAAGLLLPLSLSAQEQATRLDPIVVTPTLSARTVDESLSSVTVLDREDLDKQQPRELSEVLRGQPGVDIITNGAYGKSTSVFMRGTGSESTVLLLDGIRMGSATSGAPSWQFLPPQLLGRMEIVRGPRASLYGSDAVGGVVQVFSPEGEGEPQPWVQFGGGSFSSREQGAGISGSQGGTAYSFGHNYFQTDGIALREDEDRKGFRNASSLGRLSHTFDQGTKIGLTAFRSGGNTEFDGGNTDYVNQAVGASVETPVTDSWLTELSASESRDENDNFRTFGDSRFDTLRRSARWQNSFFFGRHEFITGADFRRDEVESTTDYDEDRRDNTGVFGQLFLDAGPADFQFSLRWDDNEAYGEELTGAVAAGYALDNVHRVRLSYGTAFRAPTFNDLYYPYEEYEDENGDFSGSFQGNPDLGPESSGTAEIGVSAQYDVLFWDLAVYQTDVRDLIQTQADEVGNRQPQNVDQARIKGTELGVGAELGAWTLYGAATLMDPRDRETDNRLTRRTTKTLRLEIDRQIGQWSLGATGILEGERYNDSANENLIPGFGIVNFRTAWDFAPNWSASLTIDNIFDKDYVVARGGWDASNPTFDYQQAGRNAFLSVRYGNR